MDGQMDGWEGQRSQGHLLRWGISSKKPFSNHSSGFLFSHDCSGVCDWCRCAWSCQGGSEPSCLSSCSLLLVLPLSLIPGIQSLMLALASLILCPSSQEILHMYVYVCTCTHTHTHIRSQWVNARCRWPVGTYIITQNSWHQLCLCMGRCI